jgi:hypothetical protein
VRALPPPLDLANPDAARVGRALPEPDRLPRLLRPPVQRRPADPAYVFGQLAKYLQQGFIRGFYNTVLGQPFNSADAQVQREDVEACMKGGEIPTSARTWPCFLGIDVGFQCYITLSIDDENGLPVWILFEQVPYARLETRIAELRKVYNIVQGAIDRFPFEPTADGASRPHAGPGHADPVARHRRAAAAQGRARVLTHYSANQTQIFDRILAAISQRKMVIRGYTHLRETVITHLCDMVRDENPDASAEARGRRRAATITSSTRWRSIF